MRNIADRLTSYSVPNITHPRNVRNSCHHCGISDENDFATTTIIFPEKQNIALLANQRRHI